MKKFFFLFAFFSLISFAQENKVDSTLAFPIGSKFILSMETKDNINYTYKVKNFEIYQNIVTYFKTEKLFAEKPEENTIEIIFCYGKPFDNSTEKDYKTVLLLRNNTKVALSYNALIKLPDKEDFTNTSTLPIVPKARGTEIWPYPIEAIGLINFTKYEQK